MEKLILECVVRSALLALCTGAALLVFRVKAARVRHSVWAGVVALMLIMPVWTTWGPKAVLRVLTPPPAIVDVRPAAVIQQAATEVVVPHAAPVRSSSWSWQNSLLALYLLGFGGLMARLLVGTARTLTIIRRAGNRAGRLTSDSCVTPITVGWLRPSVILPAEWAEWPGPQLNAVLAHESEHARRRDPLVQWLALLNRAVFWFHPLAWWLERRISGLAEEACDDAVLTGGHDPLQYSECLLALARVVQESGARVAVVGMAMPGTFLPARIRRIVEGAHMQRISRRRLVSLGLVSAAVSTVFTVGAVGYSAPEMHTAASITQQVAAPVERALPLLYSRGSEMPVRKKASVLVAQATTQPAGAPKFIVDGVTDLDGGMKTTPQPLFGVVMDPSGAVVPSAPVTLKDAYGNVNLSATTDNVGKFRFQNIDPGAYTVTLSVPGFKRTSQTVAVSAVDPGNAGTMVLTIGDVSESVTVGGSRSAPIAATAPVGNPLGPLTSIVPKPAPPVGIPLDRQAGMAAAASDRQRMMHAALLNAGQAYQENLNNPGPMPIGGNVQLAKLVTAVKPVYPPDLQRAGVEGTVKFETVITKAGTPGDLRVIGGNPLLVPAAEDAVKQWKYRPTMLNGEPVEVLTVIDVNFSLKD